MLICGKNDYKKLKLWKQCKKIMLAGSLVILVLLFMLASLSSTIYARSTNVEPVVSSGSGHSLAIRPDGSVWAWGYNGYGQLGDGTLNDRHRPVRLTDLNDVVSLSAGNGFSVTVKNDGTVWAWGINNNGQLGDGTRTNRSVPRRVYGLTGVIEVSAGHSHVLALKSDGTVWVWGHNRDGQLGDGTFLDRTIPVKVEDLTGVTTISAGFAHSVALKGNGTVWSWGINEWGQLGDNTTVSRNRPVHVKAISGVTDVAAGYYHTVALKNDGTVWTWGRNNYGQLGLDTRTGKIAPTYIDSLDAVIAVDAGEEFTVAVRVDGTVWAWGYNGYGQLGLGTVVSRTTPQKVMEAILVDPGSDGNGDDNGEPTPPVYDYKSLLGIKAIDAGSNNTLAVKNDGTVWAWGYNRTGGLGDGTIEDKNMPVQVSFKTEITGRSNLPLAGSVFGAGLYEHATIATLKAVPNEGYSFVNWTEDGKFVSSRSTYAFTVTEKRHLIANFSDVYADLVEHLDDNYSFYGLASARVGTVDQGRLSDRFDYTAPGGRNLVFILGWSGTGHELRLSLYDPQGRLRQEVTGTTYPLLIEVPRATAGRWSYRVSGLNVPYNRFPFTVIVGEMGFTGTTNPGTATGVGDLNGDGRVDINDVVLAMKHVLGVELLDDSQALLADVNGDGVVNIQDVALIQRKSLGFIDAFDQ